MLLAYYLVIAVAIAFIITGLVMVRRLKRIASGGTVGKTVNIILFLIAFFVVGYLVALYMPQFPLEVSLLVVSSVYLFGSIFVVLVLWLIQDLVQKVMQELEPKRHG